MVFIEGSPDKNLYRRYKIRTVEGSNDFAMMKEVLAAILPSGGGAARSRRGRRRQGQLSQADAILEELMSKASGSSGLAKARTESDFQSTEVKSSHGTHLHPEPQEPCASLPTRRAYKLPDPCARRGASGSRSGYHRLLRPKKSLKKRG